ncbi:MAG: GNAT family N-acetyltransferase [Myxococcota bacterium]
MTRLRDPNLHWIVGSRGFEECVPVWANLVSSLDAPVFQGPQWARVWLEHLGRDAEPMILVREGPEPYVWPLVVTRVGPYRILRSLGEGVSDYLGPLCADPRRAVIDAMDSLKRAPSIFGHVDLKSLLLPADALAALLAELRGATHRVYERCPFIRTEGTFSTYLEGQKKKFRANWKRTVRRTESHGKISFGRTPFDESVFAELESVERESWKWTEGTAYLSHAGRRAFLRAVLGHAGIGGEIWTCRVEDDLAAFAVTFRNRTTRHYYLPSFKSRYSDVGTYLMGRIAEATFDSELEELDLLQGDEAYKMTWATGERAVHEVVAPGRGPLGWPALLAARARWRLAASPRMRSLRSRIARTYRPRLEPAVDTD